MIGAALVLLLTLCATRATAGTPCGSSLGAYFPFDANGLDQDFRLHTITNSSTGVTLGSTGGAVGGAVTLSGDGSYVRIVPSGAELTVGTGNFSMSLWAKVNVQLGNYDVLVSNGAQLSFVVWQSTADTDYHFPADLKENAILFSLRLNSTLKVMFGQCSPATNPDEWHHYAVRVNRDNGLGEFFVDGTKIVSPCAVFFASSSVSHWGPSGVGDLSNFLNAQNLGEQCAFDVGATTTTDGLCTETSNTFLGVVDEVAFYTRWMTNDEITWTASKNLLCQACADGSTCPSGVCGTGSTCEMPDPCYSPTTAGQAPPVQLLINQTKFTSLDSFTIAVTAPRVDTRSNIVLTVGTCTLEVSKSFLDTCTYVFSTESSWAHLVSECGGGVALSEITPTSITYTGIVQVSYTDRITGVLSTDILRLMSSDLPFKVRFSRVVRAEASQVSIFDPIKTRAGLVSVNVGVGTNPASLVPSLNMHIIVSVQNPFALTLTNFTIPEAFGIGTFVATPITNYTDGTRFAQEWVLSIDPSGTGACTLAGVTLNVTFTAECQQGTPSANCPITTPETVKLVFTIDTSNFCAQLVDDVAITGALKTYSDASFSQLTNAYLLGATVYAKANLTATKASIASVALVNVTVSGAAVKNSLISLSDVQSNVTTPSFPHFSFVLSETDFTAAAESSSALTIAAFYNVTYTRDDGPGAGATVAAAADGARMERLAIARTVRGLLPLVQRGLYFSGRCSCSPEVSALVRPLVPPVEG
eukprot:m51a1_g14673 hypothetical protein (756) ;mRNA; r:42094-45613